MEKRIAAILIVTLTLASPSAGLISQAAEVESISSHNSNNHMVEEASSSTETSEVLFNYSEPDKERSNLKAIERHYCYGIEIGYQTETVREIDKDAVKFVTEVANYEYFLEKGSKSISPIRFVFAEVRAKAAKKKALKLIKEEYLTEEVKAILKIDHQGSG